MKDKTVILLCPVCPQNTVRPNLDPLSCLGFWVQSGFGTEDLKSLKTSLLLVVLCLDPFLCSNH